MQIPKTYNPEGVEEKRYQEWIDKGFFNSVPDNREPFTIVMPPPNVTGVLHMGHTLNATIQDIIIRRQRMKGKNACWVPGTDHASIATEAKVVSMLKEKGIDKNSLSREDFLKYAWEWTEKYGGIIHKQLKRLGASCDWNRTAFTMDDDYYDSVINVFVELYNNGFIYRGARMINWDPKAKTALSDEEVYHKEMQSKLYYIKYAIEGKKDQWVTIATTRPETLLGDTAVCVHPDDKRYKNLKGKKVLVPIINRTIPVIFDEYVDIEFGTGVLKVTPAHDINDYNLGKKHELESIDIFNDDGTLNEKAQYLIAKDRFEARSLIVQELIDKGQLEKTEEIKNNVAFSERTDAIVEPKFSTQWFCRMEGLAKPALKSVTNDQLLFSPSKFKNMYRHWMENIQDWCISRQLMWGHRIPAYYIKGNEKNIIVASNINDALENAIELTGNKSLTEKDLVQDNDVLDTWFSSWIWPIAVFNGILEPENKEIQYYYPTNTLVTAPEIIFFWVARMIMSGFKFRNEQPFEHVYFTGIVRDNQGRKMSKQLGNSPDPVDLSAKYGADAVRFAILVSSPAGNDLLFEEKLCEQGRNFCNKIWNVFRLVKSWEQQDRIKKDVLPEVKESNELAISWFQSKLNDEIQKIEADHDKYRISSALMSVYRLIWDDFCSWYLEMIKPGRDEFIHPDTYNAGLNFIETLMKLLHPFMPFISEEVWHLIKSRTENEYITISQYPETGEVNNSFLTETEQVFELISSLRKVFKENDLLKSSISTIYYKSNQAETFEKFSFIIKKLTGIKELISTNESVQDAEILVLKSSEFFIPLTIEDENIEKQLQKLKEDLAYYEGFLKSVMKKLDNPSFINNAKSEVIEKEKKKKSDAEAQLKTINEHLDRLMKNV